MGYFDTSLLILGVMVFFWLGGQMLFKDLTEGFRSPWGWRRGPPYGWPGWYRGRWDVHGAQTWRRRWNPVVTWSPWANWWPERTYVYDDGWATPWDWLYRPQVQRPWIYYREGFKNTDTTDKTAEIKARAKLAGEAPGKTTDENIATSEADIYNYAPNGPQKADIYDLNQPYRLLQRKGTCMPETISGVTSRSCYATDFERLIELTGNYAQQTNNYKRDLPDSCTAPYNELVLSFYKADPLPGFGSGKVQ